MARANPINVAPVPPSTSIDMIVERAGDAAVRPLACGTHNTSRPILVDAARPAVEPDLRPEFQTEFPIDNDAVRDGLARIARLAADVTGASAAFISFTGAPDLEIVAGFDVASDQFARNKLFCAQAARLGGTMLVPDVAHDDRFGHLAAMHAKEGPRFYASAPIDTPAGERIGTLCVLDSKPRALVSAATIRALEDLAKLAMDRLELHRAGKQLDRELVARKLAQEEAARAASRFHELFDTNPLPMWVVDEKSCSFLDVNQAATRFYGWSRDWFRGRPCVEIVDPEDRSRALQQYRDTRHGVQKSGPWRHLRADGSIVVIEAHRHELMLQSGGAHCVALIDVTQQMRAEEVLRNAHIGADMANRAKTEFLANMSHELRTPLNAILGFSELLSAGIGGPLNAKQHEYIGDILTSGRHLLTMVNEVLDLAKVEAGRMSLEERSVELAPLLDECRRLGTVRADGAVPRLQCDLPAGLPTIYVDRTRMKQILLNLLSNATKFTPVGGRITLRVGARTDGLAIIVEDTGIGMTREEVKVALEPFCQIDGTWARSHEGTGLGLPLVKAFCDLHGAHLDIDSAPGRGTTVTVLLPPERVIGFSGAR